ncbi:MAG: glycosyltransferase [Thermoleophilia bacterium]
MFAPPTRRAAASAHDVTRVDLHLHSRASTDTGSWFLSRTLLPESFVDPKDAYATCKRRGMDFVVLTDHNTIAGAMEIAHHPDVIVGVEITTSFPDEQAQLHVLAWGVDDALWADLDRARGNVLDLVSVLRARDVPHALAHPLHRVGDVLTVEHLEQCLLLFPLWEGVNGARPQLSNEVGMRIARSASPALLQRLADKHGIPPFTNGPPALTGGSDDHSLLEAAGAWTEFPSSGTPTEVLDHLRAGRVVPGGAHGTSTGLAHSVGTLLLKRYAIDGAPGLPKPLREPFGNLIHHGVVDSGGAAPGLGNGPVGRGIMDAVRADRRARREFARLGRRPDGPERSRERLRLVSGWLHEHAVRTALDPRGVDLSSLSRRMEALMIAGATAAPYCLAARWMRDEREHAVEFERRYFGAPGVVSDGPVRAAVFTDTFDQVNGAAGTMRRMAGWSAQQPDVPVTVICTADSSVREPGLTRLRPVVEFPVPAYADRNWRLGLPSVLDVMDAIDASGARVVHAATPGPMGLMALMAARTLGLPFVASHHTELGDYAMHLTGDRVAADLTRAAVRWFYSQAARIYVPTHAAADRLTQEGLPADRIRLFGRGTDTEAFAPMHRSRVMRLRMAGATGTVVLYVGRISREKGLDVLARAFRRAVATRPDLRLALVGEGPFRAELERMLQGTPHRFLGTLTGGRLSAAYASADVFCLPSATETFGQVVTEAAASALPVVVTDRGGAREAVRDGATGLVVPSGDEGALASALVALADHPMQRRLMGVRGRVAVQSRQGWDGVFAELVGGYGELLDGPDPPAPEAGTPTAPVSGRA